MPRSSEELDYKLTVELDYERDIQIDQHRLDKEWVSQPQLFMQYAQAASEARAAMDETKERVELVKAEVDTRIRQMTAGDKKPTEASIASSVLQSPAYQEANKAYLEAKNQWEVLRVAVEAFDQRKAALENLVRLYGMEYYSTPRAESENGSEGLRRSTREAVRDRMQR